MYQSRARTINRTARRGASALMIGLAVTVALAGCGAGQQRKPATATTTAAPTATARPTSWTVISQTAGALQAPASIRTAYRVQILNPATGVFVLQRSNDAGFTWAPASWPRVTGASLPADVTDASVQWDPHAPQVVFLWFWLMNDAACPAVHEIPIPVINGIPRATSTTGKLCEMTEVSDDSGATWRVVTPPPPLTGGFSGLDVVGAEQTAGAIMAQGTRLYASFLPSLQAGNTVWRLAASDDGGATWKLIDRPLAAAGQEVLGYTAATTGTALFALTQPAGFKSATATGETLPPVQFWSSADGGATWTRGATPPGQRMDGIAAAPDPTTGAPIAYLLSDSENDIELHLYASLDGGRSWSHSLDTGARETSGDSLHLLAPLPNGGVALFGYRGDDPYPAQGGPLSEWRYDWATAPVVTAPTNEAIVTQVDTLAIPGGGMRVWLAGSPTSASGSLLEYADLAR